MDEHTPDSWRVLTIPSNGHRTRIIDGDGEVVAEMPGRRACDEAHARLIAGAPAMAGLLRRLVATDAISIEARRIMMLKRLIAEAWAILGRIEGEGTADV